MAATILVRYRGETMRTILISFDADWFERLETGGLFYEYRKNFPAEPVRAYFYISKPAMCVSGIAEFGQRELLETWLEKYKHKPAVLERVNDYLTDCRYAIPIVSFQPTNRIRLPELRSVPGFVVPRMYYFLDDSELLQYLEDNIKPSAGMIINDFSKLKDDDICQ